MIQRHFLLHALSALHVGTGQSVGTVDLPIARAKASNLPLVPGSAIKGVLRDELKMDAKDHKALFGPESTKADVETHASAIAVGDANLLILPIRSFAGTVAFATCPFILKQFARDTALRDRIPVPAAETANVCTQTELKLGNKIALEDLDLTADNNVNNNADTQTLATKIATALYPTDTDWQTEFTKRFVILPDDIFSFLAETATEIRMRISIDRNTRIVKQGALWSEENLPAESVLWGVIGISKSRDATNNKSAEDLSKLLPTGETHLQIGGKHTVGRGLCRLVLA
ncbi:MAG: type III-B CRISPR module RAMP protein Cmr4 [Moraxellaceae bacterium]|jgi:CRISPR-associated protein Cmr4|nr:type III-B CRISPR module RAMP protein Cmr4 [Moraxellaceae bacterium]